MGFFHNFTMKKVSDFFGGRKFIVMAAATYLLSIGKLDSKYWFWTGVVYMFCNIIEWLINLFAPNVNKSIPDLVKIAKNQLHIDNQSNPPGVV
jgi:hypothetical protein